LALAFSPISTKWLGEPDESGIGDEDGLIEQIGRRDWQPGFFI
jgi:hypothetical protein